MPTRDQDPAPGPERRLASVRAQLLPPLPPRGAPSAARRHLGQPHRLQMHPAGSRRHLNNHGTGGHCDLRGQSSLSNGGGNDDEKLTIGPRSQPGCNSGGCTSRPADIAATVLGQPPARDEQWRYRPRYFTQHLRALRPERKRMPRRTVPRTGMGAKLEQPAMLHRLSVQRQFRRLLAVTASTH